MGIFVTACYTVLIVMSNIEAKAQSNLLPPGFDVHTLTSEDISDREYGSKIVVVVEQMQILVIWACKACLLFLYYRLTQSVASKSNLYIKILAAYVALGFVIMEILYFAAWCRPFSQYWAVPTNSSQCNALINHRITNAVFNISSDLVMLCIALTLFLRTLLPLKRKLILCGIFSLGIFVILAAVLNKYYSFKMPYEPTWIFWYIRESSTAILVANLPFTWTLLRKLFNLGAFDEAHPPPPTYHSSRTAGGRRTARAHLVHGTAGLNEKNVDSHHSGSEGRHSKSLIGAICAHKEEHKCSPISDNSQHSENGLLDGAAVQRHDFGAMPSSPTDADLDIDLEQGLGGLEDEPEMMGFHAALRSTSPTTSLPSHEKRKNRASGSGSGSGSGPGCRLSADGTGGFIRAPAHTHLAPNTNLTGSRTSSIASTNRRPISPTPTDHTGQSFTDGTSSHLGSGSGGVTGRSTVTRHHGPNPRPLSPSEGSVASHEGVGVSGPNSRGAGAGTGGGRSAADRRKRARMSG
jgi:hypothetical protein